MNPQVVAGTIIDERFVVLEQLGSGGFGSVYRASQLDLGRDVAVKLLNSQSISPGEVYARFEREGRSLANLSHPNLPQLFHFGLWGTTPYIAMEYLAGTSLRQLIDRDTRLPWQRAVAIAIQACDAMRVAHENGVIHRDLKPSNIMVLAGDVERDFVKVVDFGLVKFAGASEQKLTQTGELIGSVFYMSPEQCQGLPVAATSDVYSLGCVLYEAIKGRPPLEAESPFAMLSKHVTEVPLPVSIGLPEHSIPESLDLVLATALAKLTAARYQSMAEFRRDLEMVLAGSPSILAEEQKSPEKQKLKPSIALIPVAIAIGICTVAALPSLKEGIFGARISQKESGVNRRGADKEKELQAMIRDVAYAEKIYDGGKDPDGIIKVVETSIRLAQALTRDKQFDRAQAQLVRAQNDCEYVDGVDAVNLRIWLHICRSDVWQAAGKFDQAANELELTRKLLTNIASEWNWLRSKINLGLARKNWAQVEHDLARLPESWTQMGGSIRGYAAGFMGTPVTVPDELIDIFNRLGGIRVDSDSDRLGVVRIYNQLAREFLKERKTQRAMRCLKISDELIGKLTVQSSEETVSLSQQVAELKAQAEAARTH